MEEGGTAALLGSRAVTREVRYEEPKIEDLDHSSPELGKMYRWFNEVGYQVDIPSVRAILPAMMSFQTWVSEVFAPEFAPVGP